MKALLPLITLAGLCGTCTAQLALIRQGRDSAGALESGDWHGAAVTLGDFNGDGFDDLAAGAPFETSAPSTQPSGMVVISYGTPWGLTWKGAATLSPLDGSLALIEGHQMGKALAAGDFNNDSFDDLAVGLPGSTVDGQAGAGRVFLYLGGPQGLGAAASVIAQNMAGGASEAGDNFGASLAAGRLAGDDYEDLAVGVTGENGTGAVTVIRGGALGLNLLQRQHIFGADLGHAGMSGDHFGAAVLIADVIGFPSAELVIGAPDAEPTQGVLSSGLVYIANSTAASIAFNGAQVISASEAGGTLWTSGKFGAALAAGDLWGDGGTLDIAVGAPGNNAGGRVFVSRGSPLGQTWPVVLSQSAGWGMNDNGDSYGAALATGDHDGDGDDELAVGCPGQDYLLGTPDGGSIHIHDGSLAGPAAAHQVWVDVDLGDETNGEGRLGYALASGRTSAAARHSFCAGAPRKGGDTGQVFDIAPWRQVMRPSCRSAVSADCEHNIVYALRPFDRVKIASTTKTMTALLACEATARPPHDPLHVALTDPYTIEAWMFEGFPLTSGCSIFEFPPAPVNLLPQTFSFEDLIYGCIFPSGNDACYAIADAMTGEIAAWNGHTGSAPQFVALMNARAAQFDMNDTLFTNPAGVDNGDPYSTAYDMWLLSRAAMANPLLRTVVGRTDYPMTKVLAGAEAGIFETADIVLSYSWLKDLRALDSRMTGIKPGSTPGAKRTGVAAGRYDAAGTKHALATAFRFADGATLNAKIVALTQLGLSFCNTEVQPPGGEGGALAARTWRVNDNSINAIQWGGFGSGPNPATGSGDWILIESMSAPAASGTARYPFHLHWRALVELEVNQEWTLTVDNLQRFTAIMRLDNAAGTPPVSSGPVTLGGTLFPGGPVVMLSPFADTLRTASGGSGMQTLKLINTGAAPVTLAVAFQFDFTAEHTAATPVWRTTLKSDADSLRSNWLVKEGLPESTTALPQDVFITISDLNAGLRYLPALQTSHFTMRPGTRGDELEIGYDLAASHAGILPDWLSAVKIEESPDLSPGSWETVATVPVTRGALPRWTGTLPAAPRRFLRVKGVPLP